MSFFTSNKHIYRHKTPQLPTHYPQINSQILLLSQKDLHSSQFAITERTRKCKQQIMMLEMIDQNGHIKLMNRAVENVGEARKEALIEMTKLRYKKMIQLQNKRLMERQQFQNDLQNSKIQIKNKTLVQANKIKAETKDRGKAVKNWIKKKYQEGNAVRQQKWLNQAMKVQRDIQQLQKKKEQIHNRNRSMLISRPKRIYELNKTWNKGSRFSLPLSMRMNFQIQHQSKNNIFEYDGLPFKNKRSDESLTKQLKAQGSSLGLFHIWVKPSNSILSNQIQ